MLACVMPDRPRRTSPLCRKVAARNRLWLCLVDDLQVTVAQISQHFAKPVRTVQRGIQWARLNPSKPSETDDEKQTAETLKYVALRYGQSDNPAVKEWLASMHPNRRRN